jgi:TRAP-type C4-dicarboxylate transport system permease small subunit
MIIQKVHKALTNIHKVVIVIGCICLLVLLVIIILNTFLRWFATHAANLERDCSDMLYAKIIITLRSFMPSGISWMEEISKAVLFTAFTFIAMAIGVVLNLHINVNIISRKAPMWFNNILEKLKYSLLLGIGLVLFVFGLNLFRISVGSLASIPGFPIAYQYIMIPVCGLLISIDSFMNLFGLEKPDQHLDDLFMGIKERKSRHK